MDLTPKQEKFCQLVASGKTYSDSYKGAYSAEKMGANTIYVKSSQMMDEDKISIRVSEIREELLQDSKATLEEVLEMMASWLRFDLRTIFNEDGSMKAIHDLTEEEAACISSYDVVEIWAGKGDERSQVGELKKVKLIDKRALSDQFMKIFGQYIKTVKVEDNSLDHLEEIIKEIRK